MHWACKWALNSGANKRSGKEFPINLVAVIIMRGKTYPGVVLLPSICLLRICHGPKWSCFDLSEIEIGDTSHFPVWFTPFSPEVKRTRKSEKTRKMHSFNSTWVEWIKQSSLIFIIHYFVEVPPLRGWATIFLMRKNRYQDDLRILVMSIGWILDINSCQSLFKFHLADKICTGTIKFEICFCAAER